MEKSLKGPGPFSFVPEEWTKYKTRFIRYLSLSGDELGTDEDKVNCLLYWMGDKVEDIIIQFGKKLTFEQLLIQFDNYFSPKKNVIFERFKFNSRIQREDENVEDFVTDLHKLVQNCEYGPIKEDLIRDRIVIGIKDKKNSDRLLLKNDLTLQEAVMISRQAEVQSKESKMLRASPQIEEINRVQKSFASRKLNVKDKCWFCGQERHPKTMCPAAQATCHNCKRTGHFAKLCRSKAIKLVEEEKIKKSLEVGLCTVKDKYTITMSLYHADSFIDNMKFLIDTGADISAIPDNIAFKNKLPLVKCMDMIKGPDGTKLEVIGTVKLKLKYKENVHEGMIYVIKGLSTAILGRPLIDSMNIITICAVSNSKEDSGTINLGSVGFLIEEEFPNIFDELGVFKDEFHIKLVDNPKPYIHASPRSVSIPLLPKVKDELIRLQSLGIIEPIEEPTNFVSPIVVVQKNNKVRICGDYTQVNKSISRPVYPIPKVENTLAKLKEAKYFSKVDATSGFHQIRLDEASKKLTTIITPFGRYVYNRLPFGLNCAPEYFSMKFSNLFKDLKVAIHMDDVLVYEETKSEHDKVLREVLKRLQKEGITINKSKCVFGVTEISYLGHVINEKGIQVEPSRIEAINSFSTPSNKKQLLQFLGMINFVGRFIPNRSVILKPLYDLLKDDHVFLWSFSQEAAFKNIKEKLKSAPILAHYDPNLKIVVSADSSSYGLGAALMQEDDKGKRSVVAYASRTLTETEKHYAQIEKECLALTWAAEKFRDYIVGIHVWLETDHKPLIQILQTKQLDDLSLRLLRLRLKLTRFDYEVKFTPGKELVVADALSRSPLSAPVAKTNNTLNNYRDLSLNMFINETVNDDMLKAIKKEQDICRICNKLKQFTTEGWPSKTKLGSLKAYYEYKDQFSIESDLLLFNSRIVIPDSLQTNILNKIHEGHLGISKCRMRAKQSVWWLGISKQIEECVKTCQKCIEMYRNPKEEMIIDPVPDRPWQKVGMDLFKFSNTWYLVIMDYYSRFLEISKLKDLTEETVIINCKNVFSRHGIPETVRSDCGSQFKTKFQLFSKEYGFRLVTSSPYYSQSNGLAESGVKIAKSLLSKNEDIYMALLVYRNTPLESGYSPAELMFNRQIRDNLPVVPSKLNKPVIVGDEFKQNRTKKKYKDAIYYNRRHRARNLKDLNNNDKVWITDLKTYGIVERKCEEPRSYMINTDKGLFRRNRNHLNFVAPNISATENQTFDEDLIDDCLSSATSLLDLQDVERSQNIDVNESNTNNQSSENNSGQENRQSKRLVRKPKYLEDYCLDG